MSTDFLYAISDFTMVKETGFTYTLNESVLDIIQNISNQVGAPEYIKTPQFSKQKYEKRVSKVDWEETRNFKVTTFAEKKGVQLHVDNVRKHVNKITTKTYDTLLVKITDEISSICNSESEKDTIEKIYCEIGESIFTIASTNMFYSDIYARLYKDLMNKFTFMEEVFNKNFMKCSDVYKNIEYCSPNEDYDKYCNINKDNDKRRAISMFYINLMKLDVIDQSSIMKIITDVQDYLCKLYIDIDNKPIVDELSEVIYILVINSFETLKMNDEWNIIKNNIFKITKLNVKDYNGLTNKSIFKHMDIYDGIR
tara:strand:- start:423 stop:1352 length:930 start_codon:yes stop_codon:yes gene_type:complete